MRITSKTNSFSISPANSSKFEAPSYPDLLCHLHKEIRVQLN